jgi:hypothetical protein
MYWWSQYLGNARLVGSTYIPNIGFEVLSIRIIILPAYIASKFALVPASGVIILFPFVTILIGTLSGLIIGLTIEKFKQMVAKDAPSH